jgi:hypothetical protein
VTPEEREAFYDREIAPVLMELARKCEDNGMSLVAMAEWSPGETGTTATIREDAGIKPRMTHWAAAANGNVDALIFHMMKHGREHGHNSIVLHQLERAAS